MSKQSDLDKEIFAAIKKQWPEANPFSQHVAFPVMDIYGWVRPVKVEIDGKMTNRHEGVYTRWDHEVELTPENVVNTLVVNEKLYGGPILLDQPGA